MFSPKTDEDEDSQDDISKAQELLLHSFRSGASACLICIDNIKREDVVSLTVHPNNLYYAFIIWYFVTVITFSFIGKKRVVERVCCRKFISFSILKLALGVYDMKFYPIKMCPEFEAFSGTFLNTKVKSVS